MKTRVANAKNYLQKILTFPLLIFTALLVVSCTAFFGKKYSVSQSQLNDTEPEVLSAQDSQTEPYINECAFDEAPLDPCEQKGNLEMERLLVLKYDLGISSIPPSSWTDGNCVLVDRDEYGNVRWSIPLNLSIGISSDGVAILRLDVGTTADISNPCFSHHQFAIRDENGAKIDGYEEGTWHQTCQGQTYIWEKQLDPSLQGRNIRAAVMKREGDFEGGAECQTSLSGSTPPPPPPPSETDPNPTWIAEWAATARIKNLPAFDYFASYEYPGTPDTDYGATPGSGKVRLMQGSVWSSIQNEWLDYDSTIPVDGYARLSSSSGLTGKPQYDAGNAVLTASMGDESDYTTIFRVPKQYIVEDKENVTEKMDIESTHTSTFLDNIQTFWANIATYWEQFLFWLSGTFGDDVVCQGQFQIDELYFENETSGYESLFENGKYIYDIYDIINKSDLIETTEAGECEKYEKDPSQCKIATGLSDCNNCWIDPLDPTLIVCDNIDYYTGQIIEDREDDLLDCLKGKEIFVWHNSEGFDDFQLAGGAYILETYWKKLQMLSPNRICHMRNLGIKVDIEGNLYDVNMATCSGETGSEECEPDPEYTCSRGVKDEMYAFFPYYGTAIFSASAYLDLQQAQYEEEVPDLPDCPEVDDKFMCYCEEDQADDVALYLYKIGSLTTKEEIALTGFSENELKALVGEPVPPDDGGDDDDDDDDDDGGSTPPEVPDEAKNVFEIISEAILRETGQCIPAEMLQAIMSVETNLNNVTIENLDNRYYEQNNAWCDRTNRACGSASIADQLQSLTDRDINTIVNLITSLRNSSNYPGCVLPISQLDSSQYAECISARTNNGRSSPVVCCDVRGKTQFEAATYIGYVNDIKRISPTILNENGFPVDAASYLPERPRLVDALVASGLKLRHNGCEAWDLSNEAQARTTVMQKAKEYNSSSGYALLIWNIYKEYVQGT